MKASDNSVCAMERICEIDKQMTNGDTSAEEITLLRQEKEALTDSIYHDDQRAQ